MIDDPRRVLNEALRARDNRLAAEGERRRHLASIPQKAELLLTSMSSALDKEMPERLGAKHSMNSGGRQEGGVKGLTLELSFEEAVLGNGFITVTGDGRVHRQYNSEGDHQGVVLPIVSLTDATDEHAIELLNSMIRAFIR